MPRPWYGNPQINTRLPREQFRAVRAEARRRGISASHVVQELVADWYRRGIEAASEMVADAQCSPIPTTPNAGTRQRPSAAPRTVVGMLERGGQQALTRAVASTSTHFDDFNRSAVKAIPAKVSARPSVRPIATAGTLSPRPHSFSD